MGSDGKESALFKAKGGRRGRSAAKGSKGANRILALPGAKPLEPWQSEVLATVRAHPGVTLIGRPRSTGKTGAKSSKELQGIAQARARICLRARMADLEAVWGKDGRETTWGDVGDDLSPTFSGSYLAQVVRGARPASKKLLVALGLVRVKKDSRRRLRFSMEELISLSCGTVPAMVRQRARAIYMGTPGGVMFFFRIGTELPERVKQARFVGGVWDGVLEWIPEHADFVAVPHSSPDGAEEWVAHYSRVEGPGFVGMVFTRTSQGPERKEA